MDRARIRGRGGIHRLSAESSTYARYNLEADFATCLLVGGGPQTRIGVAVVVFSEA